MRDLCKQISTLSRPGMTSVEPRNKDEAIFMAKPAKTAHDGHDDLLDVVNTYK